MEGKLIRNNNLSCFLIATKDELDYFSDEFRIISDKLTATDAYLKMTSNLPVWLKMAFRIRDKLSKIAGVEEINGFSSDRKQIVVKQGDKLDFFDVVQTSEDELLLTAIDTHLGVLLSIQTIAELDNTKVRVTASVKINNWFGYLYMIPVKPAHKFIVRYMLRKLN